MTTPQRPVDDPAVAELSPVKRALLEIRALKARLAVAEAGASTREPLAIVGMGLRLPGGIHDLEGLVAFLRAGGDAIGEVPPELRMRRAGTLEVGDRTLRPAGNDTPFREPARGLCMQPRRPVGCRPAEFPGQVRRERDEEDGEARGEAEPERAPVG